MSEVNDFDLDSNSQQSWASFSRRLSEVISVMDEGAALTIGSVATETEARPPFVAFRCLPAHSVLAEASSNASLSDEFLLTPAQESLLVAQGWQEPLALGDRPITNFWVEWPQEQSDRLADLAVRALRDAFLVPHPVFLAPDQLAEILTPPARVEIVPAVEEGGARLAVMPGSRAELDQLVEAELRSRLGHQPLRDSDGDFAIRVGSTMVLVRSTRDAAEILVFAVLVSDLEGRSRAMEVMNDLNMDSRYTRFMLIRDRVFVSLSLFARPFVPAHLHQAIDAVTRVADSIDEHLAHKLGGHTVFPDSETGPASQRDSD